MSLRRSSTVAAFAVLVVALWCEALCQQTLLLSPQITEIEIPPGGTKVFEVSVANESNTSPITLTVKPCPIAQSAGGKYEISEAENAWSCAAWIEVDKTQITLGPGEMQTIRCKMTVPSAASGGKYAAIAVSFMGTYRPTAGISQKLQYQVGSYVELTVARTHAIRKAKISDLEVRPVLGNRMLENTYGKEAFIIAGRVKNEGNIGVIGTATLRIRDQKGLRIREVPLGTGRGMVLPGAAVDYVSIFPTKPPGGAYVAEASLDYGGIRPSVSKVVFSVTNQGDIRPGAVEEVQTLGLDVSPRSVDVLAASGSRKTVGISLSNVEDHPVEVSATILGFEQNPDGRFVARGDPAGLPEAAWVALEPAKFEIPAKSRKHIKAVINVPKDAAGSRYLRISFEPSVSSISKEAAQESYSTSMFVSIPPNQTRELSVKSFRAVSPGRFQPVDFVFEIFNQGNCHVDIDATVTVKGSGGPATKERSLLGRNTRILPGVTRAFTITDEQGLESGTYDVSLVVRVGKGEAKYATCTLKI